MKFLDNPGSMGGTPGGMYSGGGDFGGGFRGMTGGGMASMGQRGGTGR
jgi:hypothetical protein